MHNKNLKNSSKNKLQYFQTIKFFFEKQFNVSVTKKNKLLRYKLI